MVFRNDNSGSRAESNENSTLLLAAASAVSPVNELNAVNRAAICRTATLQHVQRNDVVKPENSHRWLVYLVEGSLSLYQGKEEVGTITARTAEALQPLFRDKAAYQSARTHSMAKIVKFGREQLDILLSEQQKNAISVVDVAVGDLDNLVFDDILEAMNANKLKLGSLAAIARRVLASSQQITGIPELAELIQSDPAISAQVVNAANRADGGAGESIQSIRGAISRLGVEATKRTIAEHVQSNTIEPASPVIARRLQRYVQRTSLAAAIAQVLSAELPDLKPEIATLVALTAGMGELMVLTYANAHAEIFKEEARLVGVIQNLRTVLSCWFMSAWDFPAEFSDAALKSRDWYRNHNGQIEYADLVTAAFLIIQSEMPDGEHSSIPNADNLLLARRLQQAGIDLGNPGEIVKAATGRLMSLQQLLKAS